MFNLSNIIQFILSINHYSKTLLPNIMKRKFPKIIRIRRSSISETKFNFAYTKARM